MYSSLSDDERKQLWSRAEEDARSAYEKSSPPPPPAPEPISSADPTPSEPAVPAATSSGLRGLLSRLQEDDLVLVGLLFLLFNDNKQDDPLILGILALLLFT